MPKIADITRLELSLQTHDQQLWGWLIVSGTTKHYGFKH